MQTYKLLIREGHYERLKWAEAADRLRRLLDLGVCAGMDFDVTVPDTPPTPEVRTIEVKVRIYVCSACGKEYGSKASLRGHLNRGTHRIQVKA